MLMSAEFKVCVTVMCYLYMIYIYTSFIIVHYVWQILGEVAFLAHPYPWAALKWPILNRINLSFYKPKNA